MDLENNHRWSCIRSAFEGIETPDCYLIGHALLNVSPDINKPYPGQFTEESWTSFSNFCNMCDTIANLRQLNTDRMECLSMWMSYEQNTQLEDNQNESNN